MISKNYNIGITINFDTDLYSNGFKVRRDGSWGGGGNGQQSLYLAFGQTQVGSNNFPTTAR